MTVKIIITKKLNINPLHTKVFNCILIV